MKLWTVFRAHVCHVSSGFKLCVDTDAPDIEMQLAVSCRAGLPKEAIAPPPDRSHMQVPKLTVGDRFTTLAIASLSFLVGMWGKKAAYRGLWQYSHAVDKTKITSLSVLASRTATALGRSSPKRKIVTFFLLSYARKSREAAGR